MRLSLAELKKKDGDSLEFDEPVATETLDLGLEERCTVLSVRITGTASLAGEVVVASGQVFCSVSFNCERCLEPASAKFSQKFFFSRPLEELDGQDPVLDGEIRDAVLISLPQKLLCSIDCRGICQSCGGNRNKTGCGCTQYVDIPGGLKRKPQAGNLKIR